MLKLTDVNKVFSLGSVNEKHVLKDLNLHINEGDFITVIGGNGAGKSTMLNTIAGVFPIDSGEIWLKNESKKDNPHVRIDSLPEHRRAAFLGRVFQDPMMGTAADMGIEENLAMAYRRGSFRGLGWGITNKERKIYREKLAELGLGLENRMQDSVGLLSGGQRQALTLIMATLQRPQILLLDEHTAALDPKTAKKVQELTEEIVYRDSLTALMITHNMRDAIKIGNRIIMMYDGHIIFDASGEEKKNLTTADLMAKFEAVTDGNFANDRMMLA